jgi:hypothetical protein
MACLPGRGWWCFGVSGVSGGRLLKMEVPGGGVCSTRAVAGETPVPFLAFVFWFVLLFYFSIHSLPL